MVLTVRIPPDLLSHIALRLLIFFEPYLVKQERMANAQLLMYGSEHLVLEQNFFSVFVFLNNCEYHGVLSDLENPARSKDSTKFKYSSRYTIV